MWQEWQVWGIITQTWKVCVSTFGHLRRIDPHCTAAGLMSSDRPASNEKRSDCCCPPSALRYLRTTSHNASNMWTAADIPCHTPRRGIRSRTCVRSEPRNSADFVVTLASTESFNGINLSAWSLENRPAACRPWAHFFPAGQTCLDLSPKVLPLSLTPSFEFQFQHFFEFLASHTLQSS